MRMMLELFGRLKMIEIIFTVLVIGAILLGVAMFINMKREISKRLNVESNVIEPKKSINPKIDEALEKGSKERHNNLLKYSNAVQIEKEFLLKDDYIYDKIKNAVSKNEYHFVMCTDNDEIRRDAINLIPGMKAYIDQLGKLTVTFPNRE